MNPAAAAVMFAVLWVCSVKLRENKAIKISHLFFFQFTQSQQQCFWDWKKNSLRSPETKKMHVSLKKVMAYLYVISKNISFHWISQLTFNLNAWKAQGSCYRVKGYHVRRKKYTSILKRKSIERKCDEACRALCCAGQAHGPSSSRFSRNSSIIKCTQTCRCIPLARCRCMGEMEGGGVGGCSTHSEACRS